MIQYAARRRDGQAEHGHRHRLALTVGQVTREDGGGPSMKGQGPLPGRVR